jgi:hypothetical protein
MIKQTLTVARGPWLGAPLALKSVTGVIRSIRTWRAKGGHAQMEFWVQDEADGVEHSYRLHTDDVRFAQGHRVSVVTGTSGIVDDKVLYVYNWNARTEDSWCGEHVSNRLGYFRAGGWIAFGIALAVSFALGYLFMKLKLPVPLGVDLLILLGVWGYFFADVRRVRAQLREKVKQALTTLIPQAR